MTFSGSTEHALITVYGDNAARDLSRAVNLYLTDRDIRVLTPDDPETLETGAQHSVLVCIAIYSKNDPNISLGRRIQDNPSISADVIAFYMGTEPVKQIDILSRGFDSFIVKEDIGGTEFNKYLMMQIDKGSRRLARQIKEEQYRRLSDALSIAPVSLIVFDKDKKAVFVSDHYYRAYPKIAPRLTRGLRVYDVFQMMADEEGLKPEDERYEKIQQFWYNLNGRVEFTLDDGRSYRLAAEKLPGGQGTVVTGQNITGYVKG